MSTHVRLLAAALCFCLLATATPCPAAPPSPPRLTLGVIHVAALDRVFAAGVRPPTRQVVVLVFPGSAAERAGLRRGDVLLRVAGRDACSRTEVDAALADRAREERVEVVVLRAGEEVSLRVPLVGEPSQ